MVLDILQWTYRKYKVYCLIAFLLLAISLLGYTALIVYWFQNLMQITKERKKNPPPLQPEVLTASPPRTTEPSSPNEIMTVEEPPVTKARKPKVRKPRARKPKAKRPPRRLDDAEKNSLTPSPLRKRSSDRPGPSPRRSKISEPDNGGFLGKKWPKLRSLRRLPPKSPSTPQPPQRKGVSDRLKNDRPEYKQYLFV